MFFGNALLGLQLGRITSALGGARPTVVRCLGAMALGYAFMATAFDPLLLGWGWNTPAGGGTVGRMYRPPCSCGRRPRRPRWAT